MISLSTNLYLFTNKMAKYVKLMF